MTKEGMMRVVLLEPDKLAKSVLIDSSLEGMQKVVGGYIEAFYPFEDPNCCMVLNEEGKLIGLPLNRAVYAPDKEVEMAYSDLKKLLGFGHALYHDEKSGNEIEIRICDAVASPFILGVIRPTVYLPSSLSEEEKRFVLAHEDAHLRRLDHVWKPLGFLILSVHWFNPVCWLAYALLCRDIELACDEKVMHCYHLCSCCVL